MDSADLLRQSAGMVQPGPRLAARAVILDAEGRLLLVNAYPAGQSDLWCAPGGGVEVGMSLAETVIREVREETGLTVEVGGPCLVNEFHDPAQGFHQVDVYFRCRIVAGRLDAGWVDPQGVVSKRRFFARGELAGLRFKPDRLPDAAWSNGMFHDPLELMVR